MSIQVGSDEYRALARCYAELVTRKQAGDTDSYLLLDIERISTAMAEAELAHLPGPIAAVTDDYAFAVGLAGDLGGAEL